MTTFLSLSHCSSSSHPKTGWAWAAPPYLHWVHGSRLPSPKAALVLQAEGDPPEWLHPNGDGLLPGLSGGLSDFPQPHTYQQRQLHSGGQQPPGNGHQDSVRSLPHGTRHCWRRWGDWHLHKHNTVWFIKGVTKTLLSLRYPIPHWSPQEAHFNQLEFLFSLPVVWIRGSTLVGAFSSY